MSAIATSIIVFCIVCGAAVFGIAVQGRLPLHHRDRQSKESIQLIMGLVATMVALVLSLLIASSHTFFEIQQEEVQKLAKDVILLDQSLAHYGVEAKDLRQVLRDDVMAASQTMSPDEGFGSAIVTAAGAAGQRKHLLEGVLDLDPKDEVQRYNRSKALQLMELIASTRLLIHEQSTSSVPTALLAVMIVWLMLLFAGFGLFARLNATVFTALALGSLSVAGAIFLILDMSHPYRGLIHVSRAPVQGALDQIGR